MDTVYVVCSYYDSHKNVWFKVEFVTMNMDQAISYANTKAEEVLSLFPRPEEETKDWGPENVSTEEATIYDIGYGTVRYAVFAKLLGIP